MVVKRIISGDCCRWFDNNLDATRFSGPCYCESLGVYTWCVFDSAHRLYGSYNGSTVMWGINNKSLSYFKNTKRDQRVDK